MSTEAGPDTPPGGEKARRARRPGVSTPREASLGTATSLSWGQEPPFGAPRLRDPIPGLSLPVLWAAGGDMAEGAWAGLWALRVSLRFGYQTDSK